MPRFANYTPKCNKFTKGNEDEADSSEFQRNSMHQPDPAPPIFNGRDKRHNQYDNITTDLKERRHRRLTDTRKQRRPDHRLAKAAAESPTKKMRRNVGLTSNLSTSKSFKNTKENLPGLLKRVKKQKKIKSDTVEVLKNVTASARPYELIVNKESDKPSYSGIKSKKPRKNRQASSEDDSGGNFSLFGKPLKVEPTKSSDTTGKKKNKKSLITEIKEKVPPVERSSLSKIREVLNQQKAKQEEIKEGETSSEVIIIESSDDEAEEEAMPSVQFESDDESAGSMPEINYSDNDEETIPINPMPVIIYSDDEETFSINPIYGGTIPDSQERTTTDDELDEFWLNTTAK